MLLYNINLNLKPSDLKYDYYLKDKLTTDQLKNIIRMEELRGTEGLNTLKVERYRRSATPVSVFLLTIIGAIIASRKTRGWKWIAYCDRTYNRRYIYCCR